MGLFDLSDIFDANISGGDLLGFGLNLFGPTNVGGQSSQQLDFGLPVSYPIYNPSFPEQGTAVPVLAGSVPMAAMAGAAGLVRWSARFPSLWQALQKFRAQRIPMTVEKLYGALRKFGPQALTGIVGAAAVADLITYKATHKSRRMNVANTKALRRGLRRLKGFERLSSRVTTQLSRSCGSRRRKKVC